MDEEMIRMTGSDLDLPVLEDGEFRTVYYDEILPSVLEDGSLVPPARSYRMDHRTERGRLLTCSCKIDLEKAKTDEAFVSKHMIQMKEALQQ